MEKYKFKEGDRVIVSDTYDDGSHGVSIGMTGTVQEEDYIPWVKMDISAANYTSLGTAISETTLELITIEDQ